MVVKILHMHCFVTEDFVCAFTALFAATLHTPACTEDKEAECREALRLALCLPKNSVRENGLGYQSPNFQPQTVSLWTCVLQYMEYKLAFRHLRNFSVYMVLKLLESLKQPHYRCMGTNTQNQNRNKSKLLWHSINMPSYY